MLNNFTLISNELVDEIIRFACVEHIFETFHSLLLDCTVLMGSCTTFLSTRPRPRPRPRPRNSDWSMRIRYM